MKTKIIFEITNSNNETEVIEFNDYFLDLFTINALRLFYSCFPRGEITLIDENGNTFLSGTKEWAWDTKLITSIGIGTGKKAPSINDYKLENKIAEANATIKNFTEDIQNNQLYFDVEASFIINQQTTIYEVGIFGLAFDLDHGTMRKILVSRDVIPSGITVQPNSTLKITYRIYFGQ
ncbi:MAG: hypothetical protein QW616_05740 [Thermoplasmata archaeon]